MSPRQARRERRAAERQAAKLARKAAIAAGSENGFVSQNTSAAPEPSFGFVSQAAGTRAEINRLNARHSTGPRSETGKLASSRNSLKHGLAASTLLIPGEDPAAFESLRDVLLEEHQPASETEALLIKEMAQSYWLTRRAIRLQSDCFTEDGVDQRRLSLFLRYQTTHERAFYKALNTLMRLKKERRQIENGFVSQKTPSRRHIENGFVSQNSQPVSQNPPTAPPNPLANTRAA